MASPLEEGAHSTAAGVVQAKAAPGRRHAGNEVEVLEQGRETELGRGRAADGGAMRRFGKDQGLERDG